MCTSPRTTAPRRAEAGTGGTAQGARVAAEGVGTGAGATAGTTGAGATVPTARSLVTRRRRRMIQDWEGGGDASSVRGIL